MLMSCSFRKANEVHGFEESQKIHEEALSIAKSVKNKLSRQIFAEQDSVAALFRELEVWELELVEIPGHEHSHSHAHHHDHTSLNITPEEMLKIQNELKSRVEAIQKRSESLTPKK
jgi:hypothetical protein